MAWPDLTEPERFRKPARGQHCIYVDARMITNMGIGRCIREHIRGLHELGAALAVAYADNEGLEHVREACPSAELFHAKVPIYGFRERLASSLGIGRFSETPDLYWFPQYNTPWFLPRPSVVTIHDLIQLRYNQRTSGGWAKVKLARRVMLNALRQAARIVCVSKATATDLFELDASLAEKIHVVTNGVGNQWSTSSVVDRGWVRETLGGRPFLLSVSTRKPHKNQQLLLRLMDKLHERIEHDLVLAGPRTPEWDDAYEAWRERSSARDRVHDLDQVEEPRLIQLYQTASLFLLPSLYEGFGLPVLESMVAGTPTIVSNRGALPEVVGDASVVLDPLDLDAWVEAVVWLLDDPAETSRLVRLGMKRAEQFSWRRQSERLLEVFEEVI